MISLEDVSMKFCKHLRKTSTRCLEEVFGEPPEDVVKTYDLEEHIYPDQVVMKTS